MFKPEMWIERKWKPAGRIQEDPDSEIQLAKFFAHVVLGSWDGAYIC